jgi:hypothetical protein
MTQNMKLYKGLVGSWYPFQKISNKVWIVSNGNREKIEALARF